MAGHATGQRPVPLSAARVATWPGRRRRLVVRAGLVMVVVVALLGGAAWVMLESGHVATARVEVAGLDRLDRDEVLRHAGVRVGEPLVLLDADEVARRVTASLPTADTVTVSRRWPRTVRIDIRERVAVAGVHTGAGVRLLDREGVAFALAPKLPAGSVPIVVEAAHDAVAPGGDAPGAAARAVSNAAVIVAALPPQLRGQVIKATAHGPDAIDLELRDNRTVRWGGSDRSARKVVVLQALLRHDADVYDVSAPDAPTTRG
jgi:cell division protein FtsQ